MTSMAQVYRRFHESGIEEIVDRLSPIGQRTVGLMTQAESVCWWITTNPPEDTIDKKPRSNSTNTLVKREQAWYSR